MKDRALYFLMALGLTLLFSMVGPFFYVAPFFAWIGAIPYAAILSVFATGKKFRDVLISIVTVVAISLLLPDMILIGIYFQIVGVMLGTILIPIILSGVVKSKKKRRAKRKK